MAASSTPVRTPADVTSNGTATETLIAHIKPQFPDKHDAKDADTTTDQQIAEIPSQFESTKTAIQPKGPGVQGKLLLSAFVYCVFCIFRCSFAGQCSCSNCQSGLRVCYIGDVQTAGTSNSHAGSTTSWPGSCFVGKFLLICLWNA